VHKTVAVLDGFAEGKWHSKKLRAELVNAGYTIAKDATKADIIIAHSGGCFYVPLNNTDQKVMLIGPPYWPDKSPARSMMEKIYLDMTYRMREQNFLYFLQKTQWNIIYLIADIPRALNIGKSVRLKKLVSLFNKSRVIVVRNKDDAWCMPDLKSALINEKATFYELPGEHDDCWIHPKAYVDLLQAHYN